VSIYDEDVLSTARHSLPFSLSSQIILELSAHHYAVFQDRPEKCSGFVRISHTNKTNAKGEEKKSDDKKSDDKKSDDKKSDDKKSEDKKSDENTTHMNYL